MSGFWDYYTNYERTRLFTEPSRKHYQTVLTSVEKTLGCDFLEITPAQANLLRSSLEKSGLSATTRDERLRVLKSVGSYLESVVPSYRSPFAPLSFFTETTFYTGTEIPTLSMVSDLLSRAEHTGNVRAFLSITLALRLCLSKTEIVSLHRGNFYREEDGALLLRVPARQRKGRILPVPEDVIEVISLIYPTFFLSPPDTPMFAKADGNKIAARTLNYAITQLQPEEPVVTLQQIRALGILLLLKDNRNSPDVSLFAGIGDRWMFRYEQLANNPITSVDLPNIRVCLEGNA